MPSTKLFSIIIPTRQRHDTLKYSIQSVINQTYPYFELVIMDNCSSRETYEVVQSFADERIKYYRSDKRLPMADNWELGLSYATGEYVFILGDDDALMPDGIELGLNLINKFDVNIVSWFRQAYWWPSTIVPYQRNRLYLNFFQVAEIWESREKIKQFYKSQCGYENLPMLYNSFVHRNLINKIKSVHRRYFMSHIPDLESGIVNAYFSEKYLYSFRSLSITGISGHSTGTSTTYPGFDSKARDQFKNEIENNNNYLKIHHDLIPESDNVVILAADLLLKTKDLYFPDDREIQLEIKPLLNLIASQMYRDPSRYETTFAEIKKLADKHKINLSEININPKNTNKQEPYQGPIFNQDGSFNTVAINCDQLGVSDVAHAARVCQALLPNPKFLKVKIGDNLASLDNSYATALAKYQQNPTDQIALNQIRLLRQQIAQQWLNLPLNQLESAYSGEIGKTHQEILNTTLKNEPLTDQEQTFVNQLKVDLAKGSNDPKFINYLLAAMLYRRADQLPLQYEGVPIPNWLLNDYLKFMLYSPNYFQEIGEIEGYYQHIQRWLDVLHRKIFANKDSEIWQNIALLFTQNHNFIPLYFTNENLKDIYTKRAKIMEFALRKLGHQIDYVFPSRPSNRKKIRLGVLNAHFKPQKETFITIPAFEHLNREQFEIILYTTNLNGHPLEQYCQSRADRLVKLPSDLPNQVKTIRADDLDILLIGTNITAVPHNITLLALHRLARVQATSVSSPVTTGIANVDYYISGNLTESIQDRQQQYSEKLVTIDGSAHCFNYKVHPEVIQMKAERKTLGIPEQSIVFISGANFYKIIPELRESWAKIIASVPNSVLVLYPFGSAWSNSYAEMPFLNKMNEIFAKYGIEESRLVVLKGIQNRENVKEFLKIADVYLDSYPYSGANSTIDPLEVGLPTVVMDGDSLRTRQAAAIMRELQIPDLIANSEESYINLAVNLATNPELRQQKRTEIRQKMQNNPRFLDSRAYSAKMGEIFQKLWQEWQKANGEQPTLSIDIAANQPLEQPKSSIETVANQPLEQPLDSPQFIKQLNGCVNLYEIDPSDESVLTELRSLRERLADFWLNLPPEQLERFYLSNVGKTHQLLAQSDFKQQKLFDSEQIFVDGLSVNLAKGFNAPKAINYRLVAMLYPLNNQVLLESDKSRLPAWLN